MYWIPRNGKMINIWDANFIQNPPLNEKAYLNGIKDWLKIMGIIKLYDLSSWSDNGDWV